jgi:hypothetical protein
LLTNAGQGYKKLRPANPCAPAPAGSNRRNQSFQRYEATLSPTSSSSEKLR